MKEAGSTCRRRSRSIGVAFDGYGLRPEATEPGEAADRVRSRPPEIRGPVVAALDHWLDLARHEKAPEADWLAGVLSAADPDDWRQRLRIAAGRRKTGPRWRHWPTKSRSPLNRRRRCFCWTAPSDASGSTEGAVRLLQRAQDAYPDDFWINQNLGIALLMACRRSSTRRSAS